MTKLMNNRVNSEVCAFCGAPGVQTVYKDKLFGKGEKAIVIENLPVRHCQTCGESYYDPETSELTDLLIHHPEKHKIIRQVNVITPAA
jgi:YgiT-type zinc finger domain-containing protein